MEYLRDIHPHNKTPEGKLAKQYLQKLEVKTGEELVPPECFPYLLTLAQWAVENLRDYPSTFPRADLEGIVYGMTYPEKKVLQLLKGSLQEDMEPEDAAIALLQDLYIALEARGWPI